MAPAFMSPALPLSAARLVARIEPFGLIIMVIALVSGALWFVLGPLVQLAVSLFVEVGRLPVELF